MGHGPFSCLAFSFCLFRGGKREASRQAGRPARHGAGTSRGRQQAGSQTRTTSQAPPHRTRQSDVDCDDTASFSLTCSLSLSLSFSLSLPGDRERDAGRQARQAKGAMDHTHILAMLSFTLLLEEGNCKAAQQAGNRGHAGRHCDTHPSARPPFLTSRREGEGEASKRASKQATLLALLLSPSGERAKRQACKAGARQNKGNAGRR